MSAAASDTAHNTFPQCFSRRTLLAMGAGASIIAAGCTPAAPAPVTTSGIGVAGLTASTPFYIAHRGGGRNWPEMTAYAYAQAAQLPNLHALEISVCISSDGVLVCSHDPTTARLTGQNYVIAEQTWATLSTLLVSAHDTLDPKQPSRPFTRLDDVLDAYADRFVLFVEAKVPAATAPLMSRMVSLRVPQRVVWKAPVNATAQFSQAKQHGFSTWGYVLDEPAHSDPNLARYAAADTVDRLGAPIGASDEMITSVVQAAQRNGKQTIAWPISTAADRDRAISLGVVGLMTSNVAELVPTSS